MTDLIAAVTVIASFVGAVTVNVTFHLLLLA